MNDPFRPLALAVDSEDVRWSLPCPCCRRTVSARVFYRFADCGVCGARVTVDLRRHAGHGTA